MNVRQLYSQPGLSSAFSGVNNLSRYSSLSKSNVERELEELDTYTRKREIKRPRFYNPYFVWEPRKLFQIDLIDFSKDRGMSLKNGGARYLFCVIDSFTRFAWVKPMKRKNQKVAAETYEEMSREFGQQPQRVLCDSGGEFTSALFRQMLRRRGSKLIAINRKAGTVERFQRTLQSLIYKFIASTGSKRFVHRLKDLVKTYNNRRHRMINMTPAEAELEENLEDVRKSVKKNYDKVKKRKPRFKIGDKVRVKIKRKTFTRGYQDTFTEEVFQISDVNAVLPRVMYTLSELDDEEKKVEGTFYAEELQRVAGKLFKRPQVIVSERDKNGRVKHRLRLFVGKNKKRVEGWFSDEELKRIRGQ